MFTFADSASICISFHFHFYYSIFKWWLDDTAILNTYRSPAFTTHEIRFNGEKWTEHQCKHGAPIWIVNKANENRRIHENMAASNQFALHNINTNWQLSQTNRRRDNNKKLSLSKYLFQMKMKTEWRANMNCSFHKWNWIFSSHHSPFASLFFFFFFLNENEKWNLKWLQCRRQ